MLQNAAEIARLIDHTLLKPDATESEIVTLCAEAKEFGFASVCVNPWNVAQCARLLHGSTVRASTVVGFPLGATLPSAKAFEAQKSIEAGAQEIDMVANIGALKSGKFDDLARDIRGVVEACHRANVICKVIIETCLLTRDEKVRASLIAKQAGADFVKTSTGFSTGGATEDDVRLIRETVGATTGVKASGGIRTLSDVQKMVAAGASRIGASAGVKIVREMSLDSPSARIPQSSPGGGTGSSGTY